MSMFLASPVSYLLPSLYLILLVLLAKRYSMPTSIHLGFAVIGLGMNIFINGFWGGMRAFALASIVFLFLVITGLLSRSGTFSIPIALLSLPVMSWVAFLPGLLLATIVSIVGLRKATSNNYIVSVVMNTLVATGALDLFSNQKAKPDLQALLPLPQGSTVGDDLTLSGKASRAKINLNAYLAISVTAVGIFAILKG